MKTLGIVKRSWLAGRVKHTTAGSIPASVDGERRRIAWFLGLRRAVPSITKSLAPRLMVRRRQQLSMDIGSSTCRPTSCFAAVVGSITDASG